MTSPSQADSVEALAREIAGECCSDPSYPLRNTRDCCDRCENYHRILPLLRPLYERVTRAERDKKYAEDEAEKSGAAAGHAQLARMKAEAEAARLRTELAKRDKPT